jgi:hypothetical protein
VREAREETQLQVELSGLLGVYTGLLDSGVHARRSSTRGRRSGYSQLQVEALPSPICNGLGSTSIGIQCSGTPRNSL